MAKKSFKEGIGSLIQDGIGQRNEQPKEENSAADDSRIQAMQAKIDKLQRRLRMQDEELWRWRTGALSPSEFRASLEKHGLRYNAETNELETLE